MTKTDSASELRSSWHVPRCFLFMVTLIVATYGAWSMYVFMRLTQQHWKAMPDGVAYQDFEYDDFITFQQFPESRGRYAAFLRYRQNWTRIRLRNLVVTLRDASDLAAASQIVELSFDGCSFEPGAMARLAPLHRLKKVRIIGDELDPAELRSLANLPSLDSLVLGGSLVDPTALEAVATIVGVKELAIRRRGLRSADTEPLSSLPHLERLSLRDADLDDAIIPIIQSMPRLIELDLRHATDGWRNAWRGVQTLRSTCPSMKRIFVEPEPTEEEFSGKDIIEKPRESPAFFNPRRDSIPVPPAEPIEVDIDNVFKAIK